MAMVNLENGEIVNTDHIVRIRLLTKNDELMYFCSSDIRNINESTAFKIILAFSDPIIVEKNDDADKYYKSFALLTCSDETRKYVKLTGDFSKVAGKNKSEKWI